MDPVTIEFTNYQESITAALNALNAQEILSKQTAILIKPNLVNDSPPPITTPVACCEAIIQYIRLCSQAKIVIAEGCGEPKITTDEIFDILDYTPLIEKYGITLVDLNEAQLTNLEDKSCSVFSDIYLPEIAFNHYLISVPVLKAHSLAIMTGTLKNMMGFAPPKYYSGKFGIWRKSVFHQKMQESIIDLNKYRTPDLSILDATVGMAEYHLGGAHCNPPLNKIVAGFDPKKVDRIGAELLGYPWESIPHLK